METAKTASESVRVTTGLRQGDAQSPVPFNLVLEKVVREANVTAGFSLGHTTVGRLFNNITNAIKEFDKI